MKKLIIALASLLLLACSPKHFPPKEEVIVRYVDSIAWHDTTIISYLEKERYSDFTSLLDTLVLETNYAKSETYIDTNNNVLKGSIENKITPVKTTIKWKEKVVYKDSIQIQTNYYPAETIKEVTKYPTTYWWFMGFTILALVYIIIKLYLKFKL